MRKLREKRLLTPCAMLGLDPRSEAALARERAAASVLAVDLDALAERGRAVIAARTEPAYDLAGHALAAVGSERAAEWAEAGERWNADRANHDDADPLALLSALVLDSGLVDSGRPRDERAARGGVRRRRLGLRSPAVPRPRRRAGAVAHHAAAAVTELEVLGVVDLVSLGAAHPSDPRIQRSSGNREALLRCF